MNNRTFLNFVFLNIFVNKTKHLSIFLISTLLITLLSSFLFVSSSIEKDIKLTITKQADFIVQKVRAGKVVDIPEEWADDIVSIDGISQASTRVYGKYFYEPAEHYFTIVGIDLYDTQITSQLKQLNSKIDIKNFLSRKNMIIGDGVKKFLDDYHYFKYYSFRPPDRSIEKVYIYNTLPSNSNIVSSDMIIMDITLAKTILGIDDEYSTDILFNAPNKDEWYTIIDKIKVLHFDTRIISRDDLYKAYTNFFNYKSGVFLMLYIIVLTTFVLILYQRYTTVNSLDKKEIGIFRSLGWSIKNIIKLKIIENLIIFISSFIIGINLAYIYVFILDAPLLNQLFLGFTNLSNNISFSPAIDFSLIVMLFLFFIVPIIAAILIPVWKISITEPSEAMK